MINSLSSLLYCIGCRKASGFRRTVYKKLNQYSTEKKTFQTLRLRRVHPHLQMQTHMTIVIKTHPIVRTSFLLIVKDQVLSALEIDTHFVGATVVIIVVLGIIVSGIVVEVVHHHIAVAVVLAVVHYHIAVVVVLAVVV